MWPFSPRMINTPDGPVTVRHYRRLEREKLQTQRELERQKLQVLKATTARKVGLTHLDAQAKLDEYKAEQAERAADREATKRAQAWARTTQRAKTIRLVLAKDRPLLAALVMAGMCLVVTIGGQLMVYTALDWHGWQWLAYLLPAIVEGATWSFAIFAAYLAAKSLPYGKYLRWMWMFAGYAGMSNAYHFGRDLGDVVTGALLGGASVVGPFVWHSYISLSRRLHAGRSAAQIRAALFQRLYHPWLSLRATSLWSAANAAMTRDMAWRLVWERKYGAAPGMTPPTRLATQRNQGLFRLVFGRIGADIAPVAVQTSATPPAAAMDSATAPPRNPDSTATGRHAQPADGSGPDPASTSLEGWTDEVDAYVQAWSATGTAPPDATLNGGATATLEPRRPDRSRRVAQPPPTPAAPSPRKVAGNPPQPPATREGAAVDLVAEFYRNQIAAGVAPDAVSATRAAEYAAAKGLPCSRQNAAKVIGRLRDGGAR